jgi:hypothetical protein
MEMAVTGYIHILEEFIKDDLDRLVVKHCNKKKVVGRRQSNYRDEVLSDLGVAFTQSLKKIIHTDLAVYIRCVLKRQVGYSVTRQARYESRCRENVASYKDKFGRYVDGRIVDVRVKDLWGTSSKLSIEDFDFSPLNENEMSAVFLYFWGNLKTKEIAEFLRISESAARQCKNRALKKLYKPNLHLLN